MRTTGLPLIALGALIAVAVTACTSDTGSGESSAVAEPQPATVSISTYGALDLSSLLSQYTSEHPEITINVTHHETAAEAFTAMQESFAAGSAPADITLFDESWRGEVMENATLFAELDLNQGIAGTSDIAPWLDVAVSDSIGRAIAYPIEVRPLALCYNRVRFEAAGLPGDRESVERLLGADWERFMEIGTMYRQATGQAWFDSAPSVWWAMSSQLEQGYYDASGAVALETSAQAKARWDLLAGAVAGKLAAGQDQGAWNGGKGLVDGSFAVFICEPAQIQLVQDAVTAAGGDATTGWDIANALPGGGAVAGGSYLAVSRSGETEAATAVVDFLTEASSQTAIAAATGLYPASIEAQQQLVVDASPNPFFGDVNVASILLSRTDLNSARVTGPHDLWLRDAVLGPVVSSLAKGEVDGATGWTKLVEASKGTPQ